MFYRFFSFLILVFLAFSCTSENDILETCSGNIPYGIQASQGNGTKVSISGTHLNWNNGDCIGFFVSDGLQSNMRFRNTTGNSFLGSIEKRGVTRSSVSYYSYYPYNDNPEKTGTTVYGILPAEQKAPFHPEADYIVAEPINGEPYDESNMPSLNFVFSDHLFSILKITVTNSNVSLQNERLLGVDITSDSTPLSGNFSFDVTNPLSTLNFSGSSKTVSLSFSASEVECPVIGCGVQHIIYAVVNNISNDNISVKVRTSGRSGYVYSSRNITTKPGEITNLAAIDINSLQDVQIIKRLVYWGDSIASSNIITWLQHLLGDSWKVIGGGIRGATALSIAARQGGLPLLASSSFTIPGDHNSSARLGNFVVKCTDATYAPVGTYNVSSKYWVDVDEDPYCNPACPLVNNFEVNGAMCRVTGYNNAIYVSRVEDGDDIDVPAYTPVTTFAAREYRDADVIVTYMGTNQRSTLSDEQLANCYQAMTDYSSTKRHIVVGFHFDIIDGRDYPYWSEEYRDYFQSRFGTNYLDLRTVGSANAARLCVETGQHSDASEMSMEDQFYVSLGEWPVSWTGSRRGDIHPTVWGHRAIAIMVYEKMQELDYLD